MKSPVTMEITDGKRTKVVHVNRLQPCIQPSVEEDVNSGVQHTQRCESPNIPVYLPIPLYGLVVYQWTPDFSQDLKFENVSTLHLL